MDLRQRRRRQQHLCRFTTPYGYYPVFISAIADGKVYTESTEHSPNSPLYQGEKLRCINATTGAEIWTVSNFANQMHGGNIAIASGYLLTDNTYDQQIDSFGQGPSQLTVTAPQASIELGRSLVPFEFGSIPCHGFPESP
jgi:outer membrane protein assembly factor BamB